MTQLLREITGSWRGVGVQIIVLSFSGLQAAQGTGEGEAAFMGSLSYSDDDDDDDDDDDKTCREVAQTGAKAMTKVQALAFEMSDYAQQTVDLYKSIVSPASRRALSPLRMRR